MYSRPFLVEPVDASNMLLVVVDLNCEIEFAEMSVIPIAVFYNESLPCLRLREHILPRKILGSCINHHPKVSGIFKTRQQNNLIVCRKKKLSCVVVPTAPSTRGPVYCSWRYAPGFWHQDISNQFTLHCDINEDAAFCQTEARFNARVAPGRRKLTKYTRSL